MTQELPFAKAATIHVRRAPVDQLLINAQIVTVQKKDKPTVLGDASALLGTMMMVLTNNANNVMLNARHVKVQLTVVLHAIPPVSMTLLLKHATVKTGMHKKVL